MPDILKITVGGSHVLEFDLVPSPITDLWVQRMELRHAWPMDDPQRFYGFNDQSIELARAEQMIKDCIRIINAHDPIITKEFVNAYDQDTLNYLHHIFEVYHGLLDQQDTEWWKTAPDNVRQAIANLNIAVHRCETATRSSLPRFVCTWFGMPKECKLDATLMQTYGQLTTEFGGVYLNYAEIGKTLKDLTIDDDQYIADDAFRPFEHYSADFVVYFYDVDFNGVQKDVDRMAGYLAKHREFFQAKGITTIDNPRALPLKFKVAQLRYEDQQQIIDILRANQSITQVELI
jgi:hypothetical protein